MLLRVSFRSICVVVTGSVWSIKRWLCITVNSVKEVQCALGQDRVTICLTMHNKCIRVYCSWGKHYKKQHESSYRTLSARPPDKSVYWKIIFVFLTRNICCGYSKEPSQWDGFLNTQNTCLSRWDYRCTNHPYLDLCDSPLHTLQEDF